MKKILLGLLVLTPFFAFNQTIDGVEIDKQPSIKYVMVNVVDVGAWATPKYRISVDYGQAHGGKQTFTVLDAEGKPREWISVMEILNYMAGFGWKFCYRTQTPMQNSKVMMDSYVFEKH